MDRRGYWVEAVETSFEENDVAATIEQIESIASDMETSREHEGTAFGDDVASANLSAARSAEMDRLRTVAREAETRAEQLEYERGRLADRERSLEGLVRRLRDDIRSLRDDRGGLG